jgi:hypothetical protein
MATKETLLEAIRQSYALYFTHGARSSKKVDYFHGFIKSTIDNFLERHHLTSSHKCLLEHNVDSYNSKGQKKCDIVVLRDSVPIIVLPVKLVMTNYKQNKNNSWENLTGELVHLHWKNPALKLIPINVLLNHPPYLSSEKIITRYEKVTYDDIKNYEILRERGVVSEMMNYIITAKHHCLVGEKFDKCPDLEGLNESTPFVSMDEVLEKILLHESH